MGRADSNQKRKILDGAILVFAEMGLTAATTRLLARRAGVNSALLYYYFEDKHALFAEAIRTVLQRFLDYLQEHQRPFNDARDRLAFLVNSFFDYYIAHPERMRLMTMAFSLYPDLFGQALRSFLSKQLPVPLKVLKDGIEQNQLLPIHPLQGWWAIIGLCLFGLKVRDILTHIEPQATPISFPDTETQRQTIIDILIHGLALPSDRSPPTTRSNKP